MLLGGRHALCLSPAWARATGPDANFNCFSVAAVMTHRNAGRTKMCPSCGEEVAESARLCHYCGYSFARPGPPWVRRVGLPDVAALFAAVSVLVAIAAYIEARKATSSQALFQARQEVEQSAPILAPDTPPDQRGKTLTVVTTYATLKKRADFLFDSPRVVCGPERSPRRQRLSHRKRSTPNGTSLPVTCRSARWRIVVPVRNGGAGIALTVGLPLIVQDCNREPKYLPAGTVGTVGSYIVPPGSSDQLAYLAPSGPSSDLPNAPGGGYVSVGSSRFWYSWNYRGFGVGNQPANLLIWYTNSALDELRWTCATYGHSNLESEWALLGEEYGSRIPPRSLISSR